MFFVGNNIKRLKSILNELNEIYSNETACFTGYRPQKCPWGSNENDVRCIAMKETLKLKIESAILCGYKTFLCGMAIGFDMICAETVLELKKEYPYIKLIGAIPCKNQYELWTREQKQRYKKLLKQLDGVRCIYKKYENGCMQERNRYMINNSSLVIALFDGKSGGTSVTIKYATEKGLKVDIIKP